MAIVRSRFNPSWYDRATLGLLPSLISLTAWMTAGEMINNMTSCWIPPTVRTAVSLAPAVLSNQSSR